MIPVFGGWHWWQSQWPPVRTILNAKIYANQEYQPLRDRLKKPAVQPVIFSAANAGFVTVDIHAQSQVEPGSD